MALARSAVTVDLPTPPLPLITAMTDLISFREANLKSCRSQVASQTSLFSLQFSQAEFLAN
jgi:hypothetical protein